MADVVAAVVATQVAPVPGHVVRRRSSMESFLTSGRSRKTMAEIRIFCTGLFATGVLARVISILGMDPRPIPIPFTMPNQGVLSFLIFAVRIISEDSIN